MENIILLNLNKPSKLEFEVDITGIDTSKAVDVRFCIIVNEITYSFKAKQDEKNKNIYVVEIPVLKDIPKTTYPFKIEVISDGYYFEALKGAVNITVDPLAKVTPKNIEYKKNDLEKNNEPKEKIVNDTKKDDVINVKSKNEEIINNLENKNNINEEKELKVKKIIETLNNKNQNDDTKSIIIKKGNIISN